MTTTPAPSAVHPDPLVADELLAEVLSLPAADGTPWHRDGLRCVRARFEATGPNVASCVTQDGESLLMPITEFPPQLTWRPGQQFLALRFEYAGRVWLSCNRPELIALLAEGLVPELRDGTVRIMGLARSPGVRAKLAVAATVDGIDPVAVAVGRGANRVRALAALLGGERLDVVAWHEDLATYLRNAFAPAAVRGITPRNAREMEVAVPRHQMAAAVGERGLNASLAGQLVGVSVTVVPA